MINFIFLILNSIFYPVYYLCVKFLFNQNISYLSYILWESLTIKLLYLIPILSFIVQIVADDGRLTETIFLYFCWCILASLRFIEYFNPKIIN